jgi:hypothetical protein
VAVVLVRFVSLGFYEKQREGTVPSRARNVSRSA